MDNLTKTVNQTHIRIDWPRKPGFVSYLLSIWDITNPKTPVSVNCDQCQSLFDDTFYEFRFPEDSTCTVYEFRVTAVTAVTAITAEAKCPEQTTVFSDVSGTLSEALNTNVSVTLTRLLSEEVIQIDWTPGPVNSSYQLVIDNGDGSEPIQVDCVDCQTYNHMLENCYEKNNIRVIRVTVVFTPSVPCNNLNLTFPHQANWSCAEDSSVALQTWTKYGVIAAITQVALVWGIQDFMGGQ